VVFSRALRRGKRHVAVRRVARAGWGRDKTRGLLASPRSRPLRRANE
jgi:hypothetical protein